MLPHVLLLTTTLRQGAATSLRKCVFEVKASGKQYLLCDSCNLKKKYQTETSWTGQVYEVKRPNL
jgi:hypothetical protein